MRQRMIRVSEAAYWVLKGRAVSERRTVAAVIDGWLLVPVEPVSAPVEPSTPLPVPASLREKAWSGPFSKAAQMGKKA